MFKFFRFFYLETLKIIFSLLALCQKKRAYAEPPSGDGFTMLIMGWLQKN